MERLPRSEFVTGCAAASAFAGLSASRTAFGSPGGTYSNFQTLGGVPDNSSQGAQNTSVLNTAIANQVRNLYFPPGSWYFASKPNPIFHSMEIMGEGFGVSALIRNYTEYTSTSGLLTLRATNSRVSQLGILAGVGTTGGAGVSLLADLNLGPHYSVLEDLYVSHEPVTGQQTNGVWQDGILLDGIQSTSSILGVRAISIRNCELFASSNSACRINGGVAVSITGGNMFPAGGTTGRLQITGTSQVKSHYISVDLAYLGGVYVDNCNYANVRASVIAGDITNASTATDILVLGRCTGTVTNYWTRGKHIDPGI